MKNNTKSTLSILATILVCTGFSGAYGQDEQAQQCQQINALQKSIPDLTRQLQGWIDQYKDFSDKKYMEKLSNFVTENDKIIKDAIDGLKGLADIIPQAKDAASLLENIVKVAPDLNNLMTAGNANKKPLKDIVSEAQNIVKNLSDLGIVQSISGMKDATDSIEKAKDYIDQINDNLALVNQKLQENKDKVDAILAIEGFGAALGGKTDIKDTLTLYVDVSAKISALINCDGPDKTCSNISELMGLAQKIIDKQDLISRNINTVKTLADCK